MGRALVTQIERQNRSEKSKILQKIYNFLSRSTTQWVTGKIRPSHTRPARGFVKKNCCVNADPPWSSLEII